MVKRKILNQFKRVSEPQRNDETKKRRSQRATALVERFKVNSQTIEKLVWQDEKDFPLQLPLDQQNNRVYFKGKKSDFPHKNLFFKTKRQSKKVMVSAALTWQGATKPFFVNDKSLKVISINYLKH